MKFINIAENGKILGFYDSKVHKNIPKSCYEVDIEFYQNCIKYNHNKINKDGTSEKFDFRSEDDKLLDNLKNDLKIAHDYLEKTDHKFYNDYELKEGESQSDIDNIKIERSKFREFIRLNK